MNINIVAKGFNLFKGTKDGIESELGRVSKMLPEDTLFDVKLEKITRRGDISYKCDIAIKEGHNFIKGESVSSTVENSIDDAVDALKRRIRKVKTSMIDKNRAIRAKSFEDMFENIVIEELNIAKEAVDESIENTVVKQKVLTVPVMTKDEAILQLELLGHSFLIYKDDCGNQHVMYKRKDGYGDITIL